MSTKPINGTDLVVSVKGGALGYATNCVITRSADLPVVTTKASAGYRALTRGERQWQITADGFIAIGDSYGGTVLVEGERVAVSWTGNGTTKSGFAYVQQITETGTVEQPGTYSITLEGDGQYT